MYGVEPKNFSVVGRETAPIKSFCDQAPLDLSGVLLWFDVALCLCEIDYVTHSQGPRVMHAVW